MVAATARMNTSEFRTPLGLKASTILGNLAAFLKSNQLARRENY